MRNRISRCIDSRCSRSILKESSKPDTGLQLPTLNALLCCTFDAICTFLSRWPPRQIVFEAAPKIWLVLECDFLT